MSRSLVDLRSSNFCNFLGLLFCLKAVESRVVPVEVEEFLDVLIDFREVFGTRFHNSN